MSATPAEKGAASLNNAPVLDANNITKQFGGLTAVSDVSTSSTSSILWRRSGSRPWGRRIIIITSRKP